MFYSNQILTSTQYGVATIWLVATVGKGSHQKRVNKRAIQDVNVPRACEKILDPGAPLALRLQGNLLYGVSRVFADQCSYVLSDAEKTQSDMMTFFRALKSSDLDLPAAKAKRASITLQDDPDFDPMSQLPPLDMNIIDTDWLAVPSQGSANKYSQMTPLQQYTSRCSSVHRQTTLINLEIPPSSHSAGSYRLPSHLGRSSSPQSKLGVVGQQDDNMPDFIPFQADDFDTIAVIDLNFDGDGNLVDIVEEEPQLPPFFGDMPSNVSMPASGAQVPLHPEDDFLMTMNDQMLPENTEAFPVPAKLIPRVMSEITQTVSTTTTTDIAQSAAAPARRRRKVVGPGAFVDDQVSLRRSEQREWAENYVDRMSQATKPKRYCQSRPILSHVRCRTPVGSTF
ncbi:hypothetical protein NQ176_g11382 [Zarea fungicola]|uniref:Uncharacterized protein n=1 Tax=Zarea fungicola TaxID=93591 RepID=A0ACC1MCM5_9HYPO|nr:hypothetical protein NQ176_g11382 [Lecanicillium fungicola]